MNHQKIYNNIIVNAKYKNRIRLRKNQKGYIYYEKHHILPRCLGGKNDAENLVLLTAKEHFVCHKLLTHIFPGNRKIIFAFHRICYSKNMRIASPRDYEYCRLLVSIAMSGANHPMYHKTHTKKAKEKISNSKIGKKQSKERIQNRIKKCNLKRDETIKKQSKSLAGHKVSEETRKKISKKLTNKKKSIEHIENIRKSLIGNTNAKGNKGKERTEKQRLAQSIRQTGIKKTPEHILKISLSNKGKRRSEETKKKMRESWEKRKKIKVKEPYGSFFVGYIK